MCSASAVEGQTSAPSLLAMRWSCQWLLHSLGVYRCFVKGPSKSHPDLLPDHFSGSA